MKRYFLILILSITAMLCGCSFHSSKADPQPLCRIVTKITVIQQDGVSSVKRFYTDEEKMQTILNYLRLLDPYGSPQVDPKSVDGRTVQIIISHSDGFEQVYEQKADCFLTVDGGRWMCIDAEKGQSLQCLIASMESDL